VDGGGTHCRVRLADENLQTIGETVKGRANLQIENGEPGYRAIIEGAGDLFAAAGIDPARMAETYGCFGMAGARLKSARDGFAARPWPFGGVMVYDDIDIARAGAHGGEDGAVIIVGTGSAAMAVVDGQRYQCGGWGFHIGDQMSGAIIGRELVRYAVEASDGLVEASPLTEAVIAALGGDVDAVMAWSFGAGQGLRLVDAEGRDGKGSTPAENAAAADVLERFLAGRAPAEYARMTHLLMEHLAKDDPVARKMMAIQFGYIDNYVNWFKRRGATRMAVVGGFGDRLFSAMVERYGAFMVERRGEPLDGAVILARQHFPSVET
jgi:glucosamine kinase